MDMKRSPEKSLAVSKSEREMAPGWSTTIVALRERLDSKEMGPSELALDALDRTYRFERLVIAILSLNVAITLVAAFPWLEARFPVITRAFEGVGSLGVWQLVALAGGALWLVYAGIAYRRMRRAEHWIIKSYLVDAWLDRRSAKD